jgi:hypothetical protein
MRDERVAQLRSVDAGYRQTSSCRRSTAASYACANCRSAGVLPMRSGISDGRPRVVGQRPVPMTPELEVDPFTGSGSASRDRVRRGCRSGADPRRQHSGRPDGRARFGDTAPMPRIGPRNAMTATVVQPAVAASSAMMAITCHALVPPDVGRVGGPLCCHAPGRLDASFAHVLSEWPDADQSDSVSCRPETVLRASVRTGSPDRVRARSAARRRAGRTSQSRLVGAKMSITTAPSGPVATP